MPTVELARGSLRVTCPSSYDVVQPRPEPSIGGRRRRPSPGVAAPGDAVSAALIDAFAEQRLQLVEPVDLVPVAPPPGRRGGAGSRAGMVAIDLDVDADEDAVVLLEADGFYSWQLPTGRTDATARSPRRRGAAGASVRSIHFEIDVRAQPPVRPARRAGAVRGPFGDFVIGRVRAYVLRFAAKVIAGAAMALLDRGSEMPLVEITSTDVKKWRRIGGLSEVGLPASRSARVLLFVHGTFSSTAGSFGALGATAAGQAFLDAALDHYDAVIGYDHPTMSVDPLENARDLLRRLATAKLTAPPVIDILCFSRGGLVARSLLEHLLPTSDWRATSGRVVFVAATNAGTRLAEPENWHTFIDLYTNLVAATARAVA